jgi:murein DD-endopeptidase MepM/ murein hydrolase activator NlpD
LPPPSSSSSSPTYTPPPAQAYTPPPAYTPPAAAPVKRTRRPKPPEPTYILSVQGPVHAAKVKTRTITVDKDDTVNTLVDRFLAPKSQFIKLNKLKPPYALDVGESLKVPTPKAYEVQSGDTLYSIGRRFNVSADVLAELNNRDPKGRMRSGEEIVLPVGIHDSGPLKRPGPSTADNAPPERPMQSYTPPGGAYTPPAQGVYGATPPVRGEAPASSTPPLVETSPPPTDAQVTAAGRGRFIWPVQGDILSSFGPKAGGQANDGVNIAAPTGTTVKAAAAGDVVYAGNQVPGYGNLVLIKHAGGWVTAYAYLSMTSVKIKDHLEQGDEVGEVGQTGGVALPQLHFEIRYASTVRDKAKPIDPTLVLPGQ